MMQTQTTTSMEHRYIIELGRMAAILLLLTGLSCAKKEALPVDFQELPSDPALGLIVADTITYDVVITITDPENTWMAECLRQLNHKALIDNIFYMISQGRATAYEYSTMEHLTARQIEDIENDPGYDRSQIGMIQFTEIWYLNPDQGEMTKKVHSMVLGYNYHTSDGALFGHSPMFMITLGVGP